MEEIHKKTTNGIGHNSNILKDKSPTVEALDVASIEAYERLLSRFHYMMDFAGHQVRRVEQLFDEAFTGYKNSRSFDTKLKTFEVHEKRQHAQVRADCLIKSLRKEMATVEAKAKVNGLKLKVVEENKAAEEECARENAKKT